MDDVPVEAVCKIMALYCLILAFPFANSTASKTSHPTLQNQERERERAINRAKQTNGSLFQVVSTGRRRREGGWC